MSDFKLGDYTVSAMSPTEFIEQQGILNGIESMIKAMTCLGTRVSVKEGSYKGKQGIVIQETPGLNSRVLVDFGDCKCWFSRDKVKRVPKIKIIVFADTAFDDGKIEEILNKELDKTRYEVTSILKSDYVNFKEKIFAIRQPNPMDFISGKRFPIVEKELL